jgi:hypothetical protein
MNRIAKSLLSTNPFPNLEIRAFSPDQTLKACYFAPDVEGEMRFIQVQGFAVVAFDGDRGERVTAIVAVVLGHKGAMLEPASAHPDFLGLAAADEGYCDTYERFEKDLERRIARVESEKSHGTPKRAAVGAN